MKFENRIVEYLDGALSGASLKNFEYELNNNPHFANLVNDYEKVLKFMKSQHAFVIANRLLNEDECMRDGVIDPEILQHELGKYLFDKDRLYEDAFLNTVNHAAKRYFEKKNGSNCNSHKLFVQKRWISIAASVAILVIIGITIGYISHPPSFTKDTIFASFYEPFELPVETRSGTYNDYGLSYEIWKIYFSGDYEKTILLLKEFNETSELNDIGLLILGISYLELQEYEKAISYIGHITNNVRALMYLPANWYLGLLYLKTGKILNAKEVFLFLSEMDNSYGRDAEIILAQMEKIKN